MQLLGVDGATLRVRGLDVIDDTPIIDIKPFTPPYDEPRGAVSVPDWVHLLKY
ncbi:MAG: SAM-dependent methyltransferase [Chloroflexi bacterium]|nr:SAM-dependent methyltransferase [Chloroflexota bacterium]